MAVKLVFLGRLEDAAGAPERRIARAGSIEEVFAALDPELAAMLRADRVKIAVNGALLTERDAPELCDGDEIAFLPPVSGGAR